MVWRVTANKCQRSLPISKIHSLNSCILCLYLSTHEILRIDHSSVNKQVCCNLAYRNFACFLLFFAAFYPSMVLQSIAPCVTWYCRWNGVRIYLATYITIFIAFARCRYLYVSNDNNFIWCSENRQILKEKSGYAGPFLSYNWNNNKTAHFPLYGGLCQFEPKFKWRIYPSLIRREKAGELRILVL